MPRLRRIAVRLVLPAALVAVLGGCSSDEEPAAKSDSDGLRVIQPGGPGEPATTVPPDAVDRSDEWNHTDVAFVQMMIPHHGQALEMSELAGKYAQDQRVRSLAERIRASQAPEIQAMSAWLEERNMEVPRPEDDPAKYDHSQHGHNSMLGILTPAQMRQLANARGARFDRLFIRGMIRHHAGAVDMAVDAAQDGVDLIVGEMTADVAATQSAEISRMQDLLTEL
jgi:uncharacterized protein (DUF305 family)